MYGVDGGWLTDSRLVWLLLLQHDWFFGLAVETMMALPLSRSSTTSPAEDGQYHAQQRGPDENTTYYTGDAPRRHGHIARSFRRKTPRARTPRRVRGGGSIVVRDQLDAGGDARPRDTLVFGEIAREVIDATVGVVLNPVTGHDEEKEIELVSREREGPLRSRSG